MLGGMNEHDIQESFTNAGLHTVRDFLVGAAKVGGSHSAKNPLMVFTRIQAAIDAIDAGFCMDDNIIDFVSSKKIGDGLLRNYQRIVGEEFPVVDTQEAVKAIGFR